MKVDLQPKRILVTGSRNWRDTQRMFAVLNIHHLDIQFGTKITIVHGACPDGADHLADLWAKEVRRQLPDLIEIERHPAQWREHGGCRCNPSKIICGFAGFRRNQEMVDLGADICLAFIRNNSPGATHCASRAEAAGIKTFRYKDPFIRKRKLIIKD